MIDLHCHLLANVDDGSRSLEQSARVLAEFVAAGVTEVVLTPHLRAGSIPDEGEERIEIRDQALVALRGVAPATVTLHAGFEIMLDEPLPALALGDRRYALAASRYYLVEFPFAIVGQLATTILRQMVEGGVVPLVAHPERYSACSVATVADWRASGARIQVDATTLTRPTGRGQRARALVEAGLADVLAGDNHGDRRSIATGAAFLAEHRVPEVAGLLTGTNPRAALADGTMHPVPPARLARGIMERVRDWLR